MSISALFPLGWVRFGGKLRRAAPTLASIQWTDWIEAILWGRRIGSQEDEEEQRLAAAENFFRAGCRHGDDVKLSFKEQIF